MLAALGQPERALAHSTRYNSPMSTILKLGDPRLRAISVAVEPGDPTLQRELQDLAGGLRVVPIESRLGTRNDPAAARRGGEVAASPSIFRACSRSSF